MTKRSMIKYLSKEKIFKLWKLILTPVYIFVVFHFLKDITQDMLQIPTILDFLGNDIQKNTQKTRREKTDKEISILSYNVLGGVYADKIFQIRLFLKSHLQFFGKESIEGF